MRILVSNDDGIYSPGIRALAEVAADFGEVRIVAPAAEQSGVGHAITILRPLHYQITPIGPFEGYRVDGTPADCVALGAYQWDAVDLVLSGINLGTNLGNGIWHSGTVAAAKQAAFLNIPSVALSAPFSGTAPDYGALKPYVADVLDLFLADDSLSLVNVNLPHEPRGLRWTRQSVRHYEGDVVPGEDPMGRSHFWFAAKPLTEAEEGTDRHAFEQGFVSLTPLRLDLTDEAQLAEQGTSLAV